MRVRFRRMRERVEGKTFNDNELDQPETDSQMAAVRRHARYGPVCQGSQFVTPMFDYWRTVLAQAGHRKPRVFG